MKKRTTREVFPQVASMQQFFNYGHPTPQVPFTMQVGGSMTSGMSNMAMQTRQLPMMDMGSSFIDRQVSDAARMGYMAEGGVTNNHVAPNFYINKLDKFMGKVKDMAARANEKRLMEDAMNMAQEKGIFQDGGPHTVSNSDAFTGMDFSKASNFLNNYNNMYSKVNADKVYDLANNMRMTAIANSTPYAKKIHTYDLANPYMQEDAQPINMPNPYKAMLPKDLGLAKYGLQTFQSDVDTGEKQEESKPLSNEELLAKIDEQNKRIEALEGKKSKCASGNCSPEEEQEIADEEEDIKNNESSVKDMQARLSVMDIRDKYRWNAASRFGNLLAGSSDPGRPGQLRERTYHYEFGKKGQMPPAMMSGMASMPNGAASIIADNSDVWKKWQNAPGVGDNKKTTETKPVNPKDPYNIYPDEWEGLVLGNKDKMPSSPVKPGFLPRVVPPAKSTTTNPIGGISTPQNPFGTPMNFVSSDIPRTTEELKAEIEALKQQEMDSEWIDNPTPIPARINTANPSNRIVTFSDVYDGTPVNLSPDDMPYGPIRQQGMSPMVETYRRGGLTKFMRKYQGDQEPSEVFDPGMWEIDTGEDFGNNQGLGYNQAGTAQPVMPIGKAPELPEQNWINTGQDITMGQNFGMGAYIAPIMEMVANRRDAAKQKKGDVMNKFGYENLVNPVTGDKGVYDQFGNQFPDKRNFNMYYGKSGGEMYEEGGVYFLDDATIKQLKAGGAIIEYID